jgi:hypothetical protein
MNKIASWLGGVTAVPLYENYGHTSVFATATALGVVSLLAALALARLTRDLSFHQHEYMPLAKTKEFGDAYSVYAMLCILAGSNWYACRFLARTCWPR